jgi:hypothetical protein
MRTKLTGMLLALCIGTTLVFASAATAQFVIPIGISDDPDGPIWLDSDPFLTPLAMSEQTFIEHYFVPGDRCVLDVKHPSNDFSQAGDVGFVSLTGGAPQDEVKNRLAMDSQVVFDVDIGDVVSVIRGDHFGLVAQGVTGRIAKSSYGSNEFAAWSDDCPGDSRMMVCPVVRNLTQGKGTGSSTIEIADFALLYLDDYDEAKGAISAVFVSWRDEWEPFYLPPGVIILYPGY